MYLFFFGRKKLNGRIKYFFYATSDPKQLVADRLVYDDYCRLQTRKYVLEKRFFF